MGILTGPSFTQATNAPLAGVLHLTTDVDSRVSVLVNDGTNTWQKDFYDFETDHAVTLLGFKPSRTNQILVTVYDKDLNTNTAPQPLTFITTNLPADFPHSVVLKSDPSQMEPGYTLFIIRSRTISPNPTYITIMDNSGDVVWYTTTPQANASDVRQLDNGNLFIELTRPANHFLEMNLLGETVRTWNAVGGYDIDSHDGVVTDHGTILYITGVAHSVSNFPTVLPKDSTNMNPPLATVSVHDNPIVEISATNAALLNVWSPLAMLNPTRVTYLSGTFGSATEIDNYHANAVIEDTHDDSIIVSLRAQNAVFKFSRAGQLKWILGPHPGWGVDFEPYLLTPQTNNSPFDWNYGQHAPEITPQGTLMLYNNGNWRASPFEPTVADQDNYSSAVEYSINETNMEVSQVWDSSMATNEDQLFTPIIGDADWQPQRTNVLVTYGYITFVNGVHPSSHSAGATMVRIIEYTHDPVPKVVFDLAFWDYDNISSAYLGYFCYRSDRIADLYSHPIAPVEDLSLSQENDAPRLEFSADPVHNYVVEASTNLVQWTQIGTPTELGNGVFYFNDLDATNFPSRFYRIVSQPQ